MLVCVLQKQPVEQITLRSEVAANNSQDRGLLCLVDLLKDYL